MYVAEQNSIKATHMRLDVYDIQNPNVEDRLGEPVVVPGHHYP
jgi:hypothetical protein